MSPELKTKYQISFQNKVLNFEMEGKEVYKIINTNNILIDGFFMDWKSEEITDVILPDIELALNVEVEETEFESYDVTVVLYQDRALFVPDKDPNFNIPILDFKEIAIAWRDFLLEPPLNGSSSSSTNSELID